MDIAIIGSGISGLSCAHILSKQYNVHIFEADKRIGGHTATISVKHEGKHYNIDTGFIVYNDWTYPNFIRLMNKLNVQSQPTEMSFSVSCQKTGLEYGGNNLNTLFAQRRRLLHIPFIGMLKDILRFNKESIRDLESGQLDEKLTLREYLKSNKYGKKFISHYLVPMGSAIWSSTLDEVLDFPLVFFVRFFKNHGLLSVNNRPQWHVIKGGSSSYLHPLVEPFVDTVHTSTKVLSVKREKDCVLIKFQESFADGSHAKVKTERFDQVVFACHSDQALSILGKNASKLEKEILGQIPYRQNEVVLHTDESVLPRKKRAWSSWNYYLSGDEKQPAVLSYNMNILQGIESDTTFVVTLNNTQRIDPDKILGVYHYAHPVFTLEGIQAQNRWKEVNGVNRTWFCGAYWRNGFHEDGCVSGIKVAERLGVKW